MNLGTATIQHQHSTLGDQVTTCCVYDAEGRLIAEHIVVETRPDKEQHEDLAALGRM